MVSTEVGLPRRIAFGARAFSPWRTPTGCKYTARIPPVAKRPWLVQRDPMLYPVPEFLEAYLAVVAEVIPACLDHGEQLV